MTQGLPYALSAVYCTQQDCCTVQDWLQVLAPTDCKQIARSAKIDAWIIPLPCLISPDKQSECNDTVCCCAGKAKVIQIGGGSRDLFYYPKDTILVTAISPKLNKGQAQCCNHASFMCQVALIG